MAIRYVHYCRAELRETHKPTGFTRHFRDGDLLPPPAELQIVAIEGEPGYLLLYLDAAGREQTDTFHETLEHAKRQANLEFNVSEEDWQDMGSVK